MANENGRTFTADLERATAAPRRDYARAQETLAAAEGKIAAAQERLEKFGPVLAESRFNGTPPPPAAVDLERQKADAESMAAACRALIPERKRLLQEAEAKWEAENRDRMGDRFMQVFQAERAAARSWAEAHAATEALRRDIATAAPGFGRSLPGGPHLGSQLELLERAVSGWPPNPKPAPPGLVPVRRIQWSGKKLPTGHRQAPDLNRLVPYVGQYNVGETFPLPEADVALAERVGLVERVTNGKAATP